MSEPGTRDLLRRWHDGDREALDELIRIHLPWIASLVHQRLGDRVRQQAETMDLVQEAMVDVLTYGPRFELDDTRRFRQLLARIVENNIRDRNKWLRRERRDPERLRPVPRDSVLQLDGSLPSATRPPAGAERNERREWVRLAIELLDPVDRDVIRLREFDRLSYEQIAVELGLKASTARMRFERALPKLAAKLIELRGARAADQPSPSSPPGGGGGSGKPT